MGRPFRIPSARHPRARFYLALVFLIWSVLPHFHVLIHSHAGGPHVHASFSAEETDLANRVLEGLGPAGLPDADSETGAAADGAMRGRASAGETALASGGEAASHGHFWEDANLAGAAALPASALPAVLVIALILARYLPPGLRPSGAAPARGPPSPVPA